MTRMMKKRRMGSVQRSKQKARLRVFHVFTFRRSEPRGTSAVSEAELLLHGCALNF